MTDTLIDVTGEDTTGTTMFIYYLNRCLCAISSGVNTTAADTAKTGASGPPLFSTLPKSIFRLTRLADCRCGCEN
jgi:hypothetical protein